VRSVQESTVYPVQLKVQVNVYFEQKGLAEVQSLFERHSTHLEPTMLFGKVKFVLHHGSKAFLQWISDLHSPQNVWFKYFPKSSSLAKH
jgi:hypothetical protein